MRGFFRSLARVVWATVEAVGVISAILGFIWLLMPQARVEWIQQWMEHNVWGAPMLTRLLAMADWSHFMPVVIGLIFLDVGRRYHNRASRMLDKHQPLIEDADHRTAAPGLAVRCSVVRFEVTSVGAIEMCVAVENLLTHRAVTLHSVAVIPYIVEVSPPTLPTPTFALSTARSNFTVRAIAPRQTTQVTCSVDLPRVGTAVSGYLRIREAHGGCVVSGPWPAQTHVPVAARQEEWVPFKIDATKEPK